MPTDINVLREEIAVEFNGAVKEALDGSSFAGLVEQIEGTTKTARLYGLGDIPPVREATNGVTGDTVKTFTQEVSVKKWYIDFMLDEEELETDKMGPLLKRKIQMGAQRMGFYPGARLLDRLDAMESTACYDGQYYFDTDHPWNDGVGNSGSNDNDLTLDVADNSTTVLTAGEALTLISKAKEGLGKLRSNTGDYSNDQANRLMWIAPLRNHEVLQQVTDRASALYVGGSGAASPHTTAGHYGVGNSRIGATKVYFFNPDGQLAKPFIMYSYGPPRVRISQPNHITGAYHVGITRQFEIFPGEWSKSVLFTLS
jgi:hypothetical protein